MQPVKATLQIFTDSGPAVTISLYPLWAALLVKRIKSGPLKFSLFGCLPPGSLEANPSNQDWQISPQSVTASDIQGWDE